MDQFYCNPQKKIINTTFLTISILCYSFSNGLCQQIEANSNHVSAEKIYLQLDRKVYSSDQTIWFKAIVTNAANHTPSELSGVLYVELVSSNEQVIDSKTLKIQNGVSSGFFQLEERYAEGRYLVRAYTQWNKNFGDDFIFREYIDIFSTADLRQPNPITNITKVENTPNKFLLKALLDPNLVDSMHQKKLKVYLTLDGNKDSLSLKRNADGRYLLEYPLQNNVQLATVQMQTSNLIMHSTTIALNKDHIDLQFFPESGELVHGLTSKMGFKALDSRGKGKKIEGDVIDNKGNVVTTFKSNNLGMGVLLLTPDSSDSYYARLTTPSNKRLLLHALPEVASKGNTLTVSKTGENIRLTASSNYLKEDSIYIQVRCRGALYYHIQGKLKLGQMLIQLPSENLPEGIVSFKVIDSNMQFIAERLFFNTRQESKLDIKLTADKKSYTKREKTTINLNIEEYDKEADINLSMLVINKEQMAKIQSERQNILSYFLLNSELKGVIETPGYYFNSSNNSRFKDLDALLLTQGWSKYQYTKSIDSLFVSPEYNLNISGTISGSFRKKKDIQGVKLILTSLQSPKLYKIQLTDSLGRFHFDLNDKYGQDLNISIQSTFESYIRSNYTIELDEKKPPTISFNQKESIISSNNEDWGLAKKHHERTQEEEAFEVNSVALNLDEVNVMIPETEEQSLKNDGKGAWDFYWEQQIEKQWQLDRNSRIRNPEQYRDERFFGYIRSKLPIIENNPLGKQKPVDIVNNSIPVFSPAREFYAPKHENITPRDWVKPDLRSLVHWNPIVETDNHGKASVSFYNADVTGEMLVVVEAISTDGKIGYAEMEYQVTRRIE